MFKRKNKKIFFPGFFKEVKFENIPTPETLKPYDNQLVLIKDSQLSMNNGIYFSGIIKLSKKDREYYDFYRLASEFKTNEIYNPNPKNLRKLSYKNLQRLIIPDPNFISEILLKNN